jgi:hypothetical protein
MMRRGQRWVGWFLGEDSRFATGFWTLRKVGMLDLGKCGSRSKVPGVASDAGMETLMKSKCALWGYRGHLAVRFHKFHSYPTR